jgi:hypothetical protein
MSNLGGDSFDHALKVGEFSQIYTGTKSFWRTRQTLDMCIFEHFTPSTMNQLKPIHIIEIVAFDPTLNVEAAHIYIESERLCAKLQEKAKQSSSALLQDELIPGQKFAQQMYVKYIMNRVAIRSKIEMTDATCPVVTPIEDESSSRKEDLKTFDICLLTMSDEGNEAEPIFTSERPDGLAQLPCLKHHRRTGSVLNPAEFKRKLSFIRQSTLIIDSDLGMADKLSDLSMSALSLFDQLHRSIMDRRMGRSANHSRAKQRWLKAGNTVIMRIELAKTRAMLEAHESRKELPHGSPPVPAGRKTVAHGSTPFKEDHGKDAHGKDAHPKEGKDAHPKDGKDAHPKDAAHAKDAAHPKDPKDAHAKDTKDKDKEKEKDKDKDLNAHLPPIGSSSRPGSRPSSRAPSPTPTGMRERAKSHSNISPQPSPEKAAPRRMSVEQSASSSPLPHLPAVHGVKKASA